MSKTQSKSSVRWKVLFVAIPAMLGLWAVFTFYFRGEGGTPASDKTAGPAMPRSESVGAGQNNPPQESPRLPATAPPPQRVEDKTVKNLHDFLDVSIRNWRQFEKDRCVVLSSRRFPTSSTILVGLQAPPPSDVAGIRSQLADCMQAAHGKALPPAVMEKKLLLEDLLQFRDDEDTYGFRSLQIQVSTDNPAGDRFYLTQAATMRFYPATEERGERVISEGNNRSEMLELSWARRRYEHLFEITRSEK